MGLEQLSKETKEYAQRKMDKAREAGASFVMFRRIGSDKLYMNAKPPQARLMSKMYSSEFSIRDNFSVDGTKNKRIHYTKGTKQVTNGSLVSYVPKEEKFSSDDSGFIKSELTDELLCALLYLDDRNGDYKYRNKSVTPEWEEVKPKFLVTANIDLIIERTEHALIDLVFKMDKEELEAYAYEVKEKGGEISVNGKGKAELAKDMIGLIKRDPLLFGQCIPSEESKAKVLVMQAINLELIKTNKNNAWNFVKRNLLEETDFATFGVTANSDHKQKVLIEYLVSKEGKKIKKKLHSLLFPSDDDDWVFLASEEEVAQEA